MILPAFARSLKVPFKIGKKIKKGWVEPKGKYHYKLNNITNKNTGLREKLKKNLRTSIQKHFNTHGREVIRIFARMGTPDEK